MLSSLSWNDVLNSSNPQSFYDIFMGTFLDLFNLKFPLKKLKIDLLLAYLCLAAPSKDCVKNTTVRCKLQYTNYRNIYNGLVCESKRLYFKNELAKHQADLCIVSPSAKIATGRYWFRLSRDVYVGNRSLASY